jgi:DNA-binding GntR family transcriptional regulator
MIGAFRGRGVMSESKQQLVYEAIKTRIISGAYGPGYRLVLAALAREFDVSPVPVREAIRRLEAEGWLEYTRNVGAVVEQLTPQGIEQALHTLALVEGYATALAAPHLRPSDIAAARRLNEQMAQQLDPLDPLAFINLNRRFHLLIVDRCPNEHLNVIVGQELDRQDAMRRTFLGAIPRRAQESIAEHEELLVLIEQGADPATIETVAREHKLRLIEPWRAAQAAEHAAVATAV